MRASRYIPALAFAAALAVLSGCAPQGDVSYLEDENARLKQLLIQYENDARNAQVVVAEANGRADRTALELDAANRKLALYEAELPKIRNLAAAGSGRGMSSKVAQQLSALAEQFGGAVIGNRVELPGDFFFDSGKYDLNPNARAAIRRMSEILAGENLFLMVVGYTDNDPIRNPGLRSQGVRDNLHLSLLRAKSVVDELRNAGYPPLLMYPTGWGEMRPIVPNTDKAAKKLNRRVDILIDPAASNIFGMSSITGVELAAQPATMR
ncbi:MAG: OmpA family protein [Planctomycetota bacterium]|jgi:flagellar motor protein MotB|nr:OmpA family protein [Planctomycetota bacterium]